MGQTRVINGIETYLTDEGDGAPVLLLHGSGPGVSAMANWRLTVPALTAAGRRVIAPDQIGFGATIPPSGHEYSMESWLAHIVALLDDLGLDRVDVIGNSFGGAVALHLAVHHPERVGRLVLMGAVGVPFEITEGLDAVWGYEASEEEMKRLLGIFAYDPSLITDDLARDRYETSIAGGANERFAAMFPAPRQRWVDAMALTEEQVRTISAQTLIVHGRDDQVIPVANSLTLLTWIDDSQLHVFGRCGHWTQIEHADAFNALVVGFLPPHD